MIPTKKARDVFVVHECSYDNETIDSVWSSRKKANLRLKELKEEQPWTYWTVESFSLNTAPKY